MKKLILSLVLVFSLGFLAVNLFPRHVVVAAEPDGGVSGLIYGYDKKGSMDLLANADVTVVGNGNVYTYRTTKIGAYGFNVPPGDYTISVSRINYQPVVGAATVYSGQSTYLYFWMFLGK
jgi:hypothetical protein